MGHFDWKTEANPKHWDKSGDIQLFFKNSKNLGMQWSPVQKTISIYVVLFAFCPQILIRDWHLWKGSGIMVTHGKLHVWQGFRNSNLATRLLRLKQTSPVLQNKHPKTKLDFAISLFKSSWIDFIHFRWNQECFGDGGLSAKQLKESNPKANAKRLKLKLSLAFGWTWMKSQDPIHTFLWTTRCPVPQFFWAKPC